MTKCVEKKVEFIKELNKVIPNYIPNIEQIEYVVFENKNNSMWEREFLVITYKGGAETVRNCTGNSCGAIFEELAQYVFSGYYDELIDFQNMMADTEDWIMYR
jgi:hypothetical protein